MSSSEIDEIENEEIELLDSLDSLGRALGEELLLNTFQNLCPEDRDFSLESMCLHVLGVLGGREFIDISEADKYRTANNITASMGEAFNTLYVDELRNRVATINISAV